MGLNEQGKSGEAPGLSVLAGPTLRSQASPDLGTTPEGRSKQRFAVFLIELKERPYEKKEVYPPLADNLTVAIFLDGKHSAWATL